MIYFEGLEISENDLKTGKKFVAKDVNIAASLDICRRWLQNEETYVIPTSGSTGKPKHIELVRGQIAASAKMTANYFHYKKKESVLVCLPTNYIGGFMQLIRALEFGMDIYLYKPTSNPYLLANNSPFTYGSFTPNQLLAIIGTKAGRNWLDHFKYILVGGTAMPELLSHKLINYTFTAFQTFGMTETCSMIAVRKVGEGAEELYTPFHGIELGTDKEDCLRIRCEATANTWVQSNDIVSLRNDGRFEFKGRRDFAINSGGLKINPETLEQQLSAILSKHIFMVSSIPHPVYGEQVVVLIETENAIDPENLLSKIKQRIPGPECPKKILAIPRFPLTENGKYDRAALKLLLSA